MTLLKMRFYYLITIFLLIPGGRLAFAQQNQAAQSELSADTKERVVSALAERIQETYVFPDEAADLVGQLFDHLNEGTYSDVGNNRQFATRLTDDVRVLTEDLHFSIRYDPAQYDRIGAMEMGPNPIQGRFERAEDPQMLPPEGSPLFAQLDEQFRRSNYSMSRLEILDGNVGYMDLGIFPPLPLAQNTLDAAMAFLSNSDALIIDLRDVPGGVGGFTPYLASYFFEEESKLLFEREFAWADTTVRFETQPTGNDRLPDIPVYVLINGQTGSAAENLSYTLQGHGRATVIGEATRGAAHSSSMMQLSDGFIAQLPVARVVHPVTNSNWEKTGVIPDIEAGEDESLTSAHRHALETLVANTTSDRQRELLGESLERLESEAGQSGEDDAHTDEGLSDYTGTYGIRTVTLEGGSLRYQRDGGPKIRLRRVEGDMFRFDLDPNMRAAVQLPDLRFDRDEDGMVYQITAIASDGTVEDVFERTSD